jgi:hypothetical protein
MVWDLMPRRAGYVRHRGAVELLDQAVAEGGTAVPCQVLTGMGGVGKTTPRKFPSRFAMTYVTVGEVWACRVWPVATDPGLS